MNDLPQLKDAILNVEGRVATLSFNRDDVRNALTGTGLVDDIVDTVQWVNRAEDISVLVLTGCISGLSIPNVRPNCSKAG